jgi:hypothetical protein
MEKISSDVNWRLHGTPQLDKHGFSPLCVVFIRNDKTKMGFYRIIRFDNINGWQLDGIGLDGITADYKIVKWAYVDNMVKVNGEIYTDGLGVSLKPSPLTENFVKKNPSTAQTRSRSYTKSNTKFILFNNSWQIRADAKVMVSYRKGIGDCTIFCKAEDVQIGDNVWAHNIVTSIEVLDEARPGIKLSF